MSRLKLAMIQMRVGKDKLENLARAKLFLRRAAELGADMAVLPEMFNCPYQASCFPSYAEAEGGESFRAMAESARECRVYLVAGSMPERDEEGRIFNCSYAFGRDGRKIGKHRKMHLFDVDIEGGQLFKESETLSAGDEVTVFETEFGAVGLAICYDFRFPELARLMVDRGAKLLVVPGAFNMTTGPAHWEVLFRSRAIDNQAYTVGVAPARDRSASYTSYANSILVSPWGEVIERMGEDEDLVVAELDLGYVDRIRDQLPLLRHRRTDLYVLKSLRGNGCE